MRTVEMATKEIRLLEDPDLSAPGICCIAGIPVPGSAFLPQCGRSLIVNKGWTAKVHPPAIFRFVRKVFGIGTPVSVMLKGRTPEGTVHTARIPARVIEKVLVREGTFFVPEPE